MKDGGPAFPIVVPGHVYKDGSSETPYIEDSGMTLRDYFAAKAMAALIPRLDAGRDVAACAYRIADDMLAAREAKC